VAHNVFEEEYRKLNLSQREAVEAIDGPVMVVAGPGTGKTQILALRIGNILKKTDVGADSILCLTFTNSAVRAMRDRLHKYIGGAASRVEVMTFHKFCAEIIEEFYSVLHFDVAPRILEDTEGVSICDQILRENEWKHLHPRGDIGRHFKELKSLISLLKREGLSPSNFLKEIENEIEAIKKDPENISTRGESKGKLKKEFTEKMEGLERTKEIVNFYELYEKKKQEEFLMDYDDTILYALEIMKQGEEARALVCEKYMYVLIDEHQDSSGSQNGLLKAIWQGEEKPNIFAVGDDRQLIYAFGGAKMSHFEEFKSMFGKTKIIFLTDNYRSTQNILNTADALLTSSFSDKKLVATVKENHNLKLFECDYPRDEIILCGLEIKEKLKNKQQVDINNCAVLVPKNKQVVSAIKVLKDMGLKVASMQSLSLFEAPEFEIMSQVLKICQNSDDAVSLAETILNPITGIPVLSAHEYLYKKRGKDISLQNMFSRQENLFEDNKELKNWIEKLKNLVSLSISADVYELVQMVGDEVLIKTAKEHEELVRRIEVVRSLLHLALSFTEKKSKESKNSLSEFIAFIERLRTYGEDIPLAVFGSDEGVKVMTLHASKGLEFDYVWIAHLDEGSLMKGKRRNFKLPESVALKVEEKDEIAAKRELYVAITRAKRFCHLSYSRFSYSGQNQELSKIVSDLVAKGDIFERFSFKETENKILAHDQKTYVVSNKEKDSVNVLEKLKKMVAKEYVDTNVSVSMLNNFFECPWRWYFRNLLKLPEAKSESLEFGSAVHSAVDKLLKLKKIPTGKEMEKVAEGNKEILKIISNWAEKRLPEISDHRENEKSISFHAKEFPRLNIYGKIDLVEELRDKDVRVTDFKTGNPRKRSDIEKLDEEGRMSDYMRQLAMYSYLFEQSRKEKVKVSESRLEFLEAPPAQAGKNDKSYFYDTVISGEQIDLLIKDIKDYDSLVKEGRWVDRPCNFKSFGKQGAVCEYCKLAEIYKN